MDPCFLYTIFYIDQNKSQNILFFHKFTTKNKTNNGIIYERAYNF